MRFIIIFIILIYLTNCGNINKIHRISGIDLDNIQADSTVSLRSDGLYTLNQTKLGHDGDKYKIYCPLIFLNNKKAHWIYNSGSYDDDELRLNYYNKYINFMNFGNFVIHNDTLWAKLPIFLNERGMIPRTYEAYFQGKIKNQDTILNWHMIAPFPKVNKEFNDNFELLTSPNQFYFIESKELLGLDSLYQLSIGMQ